MKATTAEKDYIWFSLDRFTANPNVKEQAYYWILSKLENEEIREINDNILIQSISRREA